MAMPYTRVHNTPSHHEIVNNKLCQTNLVSSHDTGTALWQETKKMSCLGSGAFFDVVSYDILLMKFRKRHLVESGWKHVKMFSKR